MISSVKLVIALRNKVDPDITTAFIKSLDVVQKALHLLKYYSSTVTECFENEMVSILFEIENRWQ